MFLRRLYLVQLIVILWGVVELSPIDMAKTLEARLEKRTFHKKKWRCGPYHKKKSSPCSSYGPSDTPNLDPYPEIDASKISTPIPISPPILPSSPAPEPKIIYVEHPVPQPAPPPQIIFIQEPAEPQSAAHATEDIMKEISAIIPTPITTPVYLPKQCSGDNCASTTHLTAYPNSILEP